MEDSADSPLMSGVVMRKTDFQNDHKVSAWFPGVILPSTAIACRNLLPAWAFMWILSFAIYLSLKWLTWRTVRSRIAHPLWRSLAYFLAWPGMDANAFLDAREREPLPSLRLGSGRHAFWAYSCSG
jgi:hypothetical protein